MDVSFIIVNYNTTALTVQCIESIKRFTLEQKYEIIVVDNASPDRSIVSITKQFPDIVLILNPENAGFGQANNIGILRARGKYVFLINSDTYLLNDAVSIFWETLENEAYRKVAVCGADLFYPDGSAQISFGNFPSILEAISTLGFSFFYKTYFRERICSGVINYSNEIRDVDYITGADMFIRKEALDKTGAFDPDFFMYFEETELSYRFKKAGYKSILVPEAKIVHIEGGSQKLGEYFNFNKIKMYETSRNLFFKKTKGKFYAMVVKMISVVRNLVLFVLKQNKGYYRKARIILSA